MELFVSTGQCDEHGLKTLIARAEAGDVIVFVAMCDRIAELLLAEGQRPVDVRRARASGCWATPHEPWPCCSGTRCPTPRDCRRGAARRPRLRDVRRARTAAPVPMDPDRLRPRAVLHVRISEEALRSAAASRSPTTGSAR